MAASSGLYNSILFTWMLPMVLASVMVTGHPRDQGVTYKYSPTVFGFIETTQNFQQDLKAFSMC